MRAPASPIDVDNAASGIATGPRTYKAMVQSLRRRCHVWDNVDDDAETVVGQRRTWREPFARLASMSLCGRRRHSRRRTGCCLQHGESNVETPGLAR